MEETQISNQDLVRLTVALVWHLPSGRPNPPKRRLAAQSRIFETMLFACFDVQQAFHPKKHLRLQTQENII